MRCPKSAASARRCIREKPIYDIPAHPAIEAGALITELERQIAPFQAPRLLGRRVEALEGEVGGFTLRTDRGEEVRARAVVIAAGAGCVWPEPAAAGRARGVRGLRRGAVFR